MTELTKLIDITVNDIADYLRIPELITEEENYLTTLLTVSKAYVSDYTGLTAEELDEHADIIIAVLVLIEDMYENRAMYVESDKPNKVVETILGMHQVNLL